MGCTRTLCSSLFLALLLPFAGGCATLRHLAVLDPAAGGQGRTAILFGYSFEAGGEFLKDYGCQLFFKSEGDGVSYSMDIQAGKDAALVEAPPGIYTADHLYCSTSHHWDLLTLRQRRITVRSGKVNYLGRLHLKISQDLSTLTTRFADPKEDITYLANIYKELSPAYQKGLVAAYSGRVISEPMLAPRETYLRHVEVKNYHPKSKISLDSLDEKFRACLESEKETNPVQIGTLAYVADYSVNELKKLDKTVDETTFSESFAQCAQNAFKGFRHGQDERAVIKVRF